MAYNPHMIAQANNPAAAPKTLIVLSRTADGKMIAMPAMQPAGNSQIFIRPTTGNVQPNQINSMLIRQQALPDHEYGPGPSSSSVAVPAPTRFSSTPGFYRNVAPATGINQRLPLQGMVYHPHQPRFQQQQPVYQQRFAPPPQPHKHLMPPDTSPIASGSAAGAEAEPPPIDLVVRNVFAIFHTRCHLNLKDLALRMSHVVYDQGKGHVQKQIRNPHALVKIWSTGRVTLTGLRSESQAKLAARQMARKLQKLNPRVRFCGFRVPNMMLTTRLPFGVQIHNLAQDFPGRCEYEPELQPGLKWESKDPKAVLQIHTTGSITITGATSVASVQDLLESMMPILSRYQCAPAVAKSSPRKRRAEERTRNVNKVMKQSTDDIWQQAFGGVAGGCSSDESDSD